MSEDSTTQCLLFPGIFRKPVVAQFDQREGSSDGGALLLSEDPIHKLLLDRDPIEGRDLASQSTLSRFENGVGVKELYRAGEFLAEKCDRASRQAAAPSRLSRHHRSGPD
jgi:hypothetical protein